MEDEHFYKSILESMRDMVLVKGPESRLLWANKAFRHYYGMTADELRGLIDGAQSNPDDTLQYVRDHKFVFDERRDLNIPSEPVTNSDGEVGYFHTVKSPIFNKDEMNQLVAVSRRIEDKEIEEQDLTELDAKVFTAPLRSIIDSYPIATMLLDHDLRIIKCNQRWSKYFGDAP
ncbi:MAG: PAS domain-containing protein, partial [Gammaproteobacteria bacterium]